MTLEDFFTLTEMKDGLTVPSRVEELLNVMQKEKDCVVKNVGDATRQWAAVASTIAATENKDCLDLFIQLDGLWFIDRWLKDAQKFGKDTSDTCVEESITALLRALEKLHIDNERSISSGILITVKNLLGHNSSKVQDRARMLFDSWKHGKDCDSIHQDVDDGSRRLAEEDCGQSALDNPIARGSANEENHVLEHTRDEVPPLSRSDDLQPEKIEDVQIPNHHDQAGSHIVSGPEDTKDGPPDPLASSLLSNPLQENPSIKEESPLRAAEGSTSTGTCSVTVTKQGSDEVLSDAVRLDESSKSEKQVLEASNSSNKLGTTEISSASGALESGAACTGDEPGSELVREPALQNSVDANEKPASDFKSRLDDMRVINRCSANAFKTTGQDGECCSNALLSANGSISGNPEDLDTTFSRMEDIGEADEDKEHTSDEGDDFMKASDFPKSAMQTKNPDMIEKRRSDIELEYGMVDALEVARQVAQEVEREMVDCREPFCSSSSEKSSEGGIRQPGSPDSINGKQDLPTDVPQEEVPTGQSHSAETNLEGEGGSINSDNLDNEPENSTHDMESSQVTEAAQEPEVNIEKGLSDFDLNQEVCSDEMDCPMNPLTPISFVSASRPAAAPGLPIAPLQFEGSLGWKGCAAINQRHGEDFRCAFTSQRPMPKLLPSIENVEEERDCTSPETFLNQEIAAGTSRKCSRLWPSEDVLEVLKNNTGTYSVKGIPFVKRQRGSTRSISMLEPWFKRFLQETLGSPEDLCRRRKFMEYFMNPSPSHVDEPEPNQSSGQSDSNPRLKRLLKSLLSLLYQGDPARYHCYEYIFPQIKIAAPPRWFKYQNVSSVIKMELPSNLNDNTRWMGFTVYALFTVPKQSAFSGDNQDSLVFVKFSSVAAGDPVAPGIGFSLSRDTFVGSHRLLICYMPRELFKLNGCSNIWASFKSNNPSMEVGMCGIRPVYEQDVEEFVETLVECMLGCTDAYHDSICANLLENVAMLQECRHGEDFRCSFTSQRPMPKLLHSIETIEEEEDCTSPKTFPNQEIEARTSRNSIPSFTLGIPFMKGQSGTAETKRMLQTWYKRFGQDHYNPRGIFNHCFRESEIPQGFRSQNNMSSVTIGIPQILRGIFNQCFPESEIPQWFRSQNSGSSVTIGIPQNLFNDSNWMGFAMCAVFPFHKHTTAVHKNLDLGINPHRVICQVQTDIGGMSPISLSYSISEDEVLISLYKRAFLWVSFTPSGNWVWSRFWNQMNWAKFSFLSDTPDVSSAVKCGVNLVYRDNLDEFTRTIVQLLTSYADYLSPVRNTCKKREPTVYKRLPIYHDEARGTGSSSEEDPRPQWLQGLSDYVEEPEKVVKLHPDDQEPAGSKTQPGFKPKVGTVSPPKRGLVKGKIFNSIASAVSKLSIDKKSKIRKPNPPKHAH